MIVNGNRANAAAQRWLYKQRTAPQDDAEAETSDSESC